MRRQLGAEGSDNSAIAARNRDLRSALLDVLAGKRPEPHGLGNGFRFPSEEEQMRIATGPEIHS